MNLDVDIQLKQGRFALDARFKCTASSLGLFGPSGCGKTTLFRALAGLVRPDCGHIILDGETLFDAAHHDWQPPHKRNIGLVFQDARLFPHWSVEQNLRAGEVMTERVAGRPFTYDEMVDLLDIGHLIRREIHDLSGGEQQRIAIGRTLLSNPKLLLMDEPVTGLDATLKMQILPFLARVHGHLRIPTLLISHDLGEILQLTDQLLLMRDGRTAAYGKLTDLVERPETLDTLRGAELNNLLQSRVVRHDPQRGLTHLETLGDTPHPIELPLHESLQPDQHLTLSVPADRIVLATGSVEGLSMRNCLPGTVAGILHAADRSICHIDTPAGRLFAEITPATEQELNLKPGMYVQVLFKSMATRSA